MRFCCRNIWYSTLHLLRSICKWRNFWLRPFLRYEWIETSKILLETSALRDFLPSRFCFRAANQLMKLTILEYFNKLSRYVLCRSLTWLELLKFWWISIFTWWEWQKWNIYILHGCFALYFSVATFPIFWFPDANQVQIAAVNIGRVSYFPL